MIVRRVEKHVIKSNSVYYAILCDFAYKSKNLYNHANYLIREEYIKNKKWLRHYELDKILRNDIEYPDYKNMPTAQSAQQLLRLIDGDWKSFFRAIKDWSVHKEKYTGRPKLPKYKDKNGKHIIILTYQEARLKGNKIEFPRIFKGLSLKPRFITLENYISFQQVRMIPRYKSFVIELIYNIDVPDKKMLDNQKYISIDIGLDNLATITNNIKLDSIIINGKGLKSINKYYNKKLSHYHEVTKRMNNKDYSNRMNKITIKRNNKINDYIHKASKYIIDYSLVNNINTIVIGNNKNWKQNSAMSKKVNQSFVGIPHMKFIEMIRYKAQNVGLNVILTEEKYTSGTSFLDCEPPEKKYYNKNRRISRGLFVSNKGIKINADSNGSYQIMKKVFPNAFADGIEGVALHPIRVNMV